MIYGRHVKWLISGIILLGLMMSIAYVKLLESRSQIHQKIISELNTLRQLDVQVNLNVFKTRMALLQYYDPLVTEQKEIHNLLENLIRIQESAGANVASTQTLDRLVQLMNEKSELIEQFKSKNAVLRNSISFFPEDAENLADRASEQDPDLELRMRRLMRSMLVFTNNSDAENYADTVKCIEALVARMAYSPSPLREDLHRVVKHARQIIQTKVIIDKLMIQINAIPSESYIVQLNNLYDSDHHATLQDANIYRLYIFLALFATLLLGYTGLVLYRLRHSVLALRQEQMQAQVTLQSIGDAVITTGETGNIEYMNPLAEKMSGWPMQEAKNQPLTHVFHLVYEGDGMEGIVFPDTPLHQDALFGIHKARLICRDGDAILVELSSSPIREDGKERGSVLILRDLSEKQAVQKTLADHDMRYQAVMDNVADAILTMNEEGCVASFNPAASRIFGYDPGEIVGQNLTVLMPPEYRASHASGLKRYLETRSPHLVGKGSVEVAGLRKNGETFPLELEISEMPWQGRWMFIGIMRDITQRKAAEEKLSYLANFDTLTGLPNRTLFRDRLDHAMTQASRHEYLLSLLFIDLDRFKTINDTLGHYVGDQLLQDVAERLTKCVRQGDTVARLGGDEFTIIMEAIHHVEAAAECARRILDSLSQPFMLEGREVFVSCSIGITIFPFDDEGLDNLLKNADTAMYRAKAVGRNNFQFYTADMNARALERLNFENQLRGALERNEFKLYYQPKFDLRLGRIIGMEALIRWEHPHQGMIAPQDFIPLLEETRLIVPVGEWVIKEACMQNRRWQNAGLPPLRVAVNLSAAQLQSVNLMAGITQSLITSGLDARYLEVEITESMVARNPEEAIQILSKIKELGVSIAMDDFGTGYSSLHYLKHFPIDSLKIDRSFIRDIPQDSDDSAITQAIIAMAHSLRLRVVAEGVEDEEQCIFLRANACDEAQGFYYSKPLPADAFADFLRLEGSMPVKKTLRPK